MIHYSGEHAMIYFVFSFLFELLFSLTILYINSRQIMEGKMIIY